MASVLTVCFGAGRKGLAALSLNTQYPKGWDVIYLTYEVRGLPSPLDIRAHSTRGVASSTALFRGVSLEDICMQNDGWQLGLSKSALKLI